MQNLAVGNALDLYEPTVYREGCFVDIGRWSDGDFNVNTAKRREFQGGLAEVYISKIRC